MTGLPSEVLNRPHNGRAEYRVPDPDFPGRPDIGGQILMIRESMRYMTYTGAVGRQTGKTTTRPFLWAEEAQETKGLYRAGFIAQDHAKAYEMMEFTIAQFGGRPDVVGPKNTLVTEVVGGTKDQRRFIRIKPLKRSANELYGDEPLAINEGLELWFWSGAHPYYEKIRGYVFHFNRISVDEAQLQHPNLLNVINAMMLIVRGKIDVTGTPSMDGEGNLWFKEWFEHGQDETMPEWGSMNYPTHMNPLLTEEAIADMKSRSRTPEAWTQEGLAKFVTGRGAVFDRTADVLSLPVSENLPKWYYTFWDQVYEDDETGGARVWAWHGADPDPLHRYIMAVDWARVRDATVISVVDQTKMEQVFLMCFRNEEYDEMVEWVSLLHSHYNNAIIHSDQNGVGDSMTRTLQKRFKENCIGHKWQGQGSSKKASYVRDAQSLFNHVEVKLLNVHTQRHEFESFIHVKNETTGRVSYKHPPEGHDDFVDTLLMMAPALREGGRKAVKAPKKDAPWLSIEWMRQQRKKRKWAREVRGTRI